ncbi:MULTISPECIES: hypothetical protein [Paraburkholderia]|uniref:hypothetical protein n=1 Tax=Paraburkholderia TaxID=1822464 RepID=UPI000255393E|nr:hypothetical protein [Paraburkholderia dioscoreae]
MFRFVGAALLAASVVKQFLFDLSHVTWDRVGRIVYRHRVDVAADRPLPPLPPKALVLETEQ